MAEVTDLSKLQQEVNNLVEQRLKLRGQFDLLQGQKKQVSSEIKSIESNLLGLDVLFQEKLDELNKYR